MPAAQQSVTASVLATAKVDPSTEIAAIPPDDALTVYIEASKMIDDLERQVDELKKLNNQIEPEIVRHFQEKGQQRVTRAGRTVYLARELWPKIISDDLVDAATDDAGKKAAGESARQRLVEALAQDPETSHLVKASYNHMTLRSFILHDLEEGDDGMPVIPEHLKGKLGVSEQFKAKVLRSA